MMRLLPFPAAMAMLLLSGCTSPGPYPSLGLRDSERVSGTMAPPASAFVPTPLSNEAATSLSDLTGRILAAHQRFVAALPEAQTVVRSAAGSADGTDGWSRAQVAVANLESIRSDAMIALADLDRLHVEAQTGGGDIAQTDAALAEAGALVAQQDRLIADLLDQLRS